MDWSLQDRVAVVTGGSRGIGFGVVEALLAEGARVLFCGRDPERVNEACKGLRRNWGDRVHSIVADVRIYHNVESIFNTVEQRFGRLDILVNNAGVGVFGNVEELTLEEWHSCLDTNLTAVFYCCKYGIPLLKRSGGGFIVNVSSLAGRNAFPGGAAYNASKFGLNGFSEALFQEVRYDNIRVTCIAPGSVETEFRGNEPSPQTWKLLPEDVARAVVQIVKFPDRSLPSYLEIRPSKPMKRK
jgi:NAD(P)-dependent dehydrogenase (short-subunit alcohol dehydrogenase family)